MINIIKAILLLIGITYGFSNMVKACYHKSISSFQIWFMSIGIVGFIYLQFWY